MKTLYLNKKQAVCCNFEIEVIHELLSEIWKLTILLGLNF